MKRQYFTRRETLAALGSASAVSLAGCMGGDDTYQAVIATGQDGSAAYQMSQGLSSIVNEYSDEMDMEALPASNASQTIRRMEDGELDFGYTDVSDAYRMMNSIGPYEDEPVDADLRHVFHFYDVQNAVIGAADEGIETISDLEGETIALGAVGGPPHELLRDMVAEDADIDEISIDDPGWADQGSAMDSGRIVAAADIRLNQTTPAYIEELYSILDDPAPVYLEWSDEAMDAIESDPEMTGQPFPVEEMEGPDYRGAEEAYWSEVIYYLFASSETEDWMVEELLAVMWDNVDELATYHDLNNYWTEPEFLVEGRQEDIPFHSSAEAFYADLDIEV